MKILFTVCARKGSKGLKNKNISEFLGKPLCYYTLSAYELFKKKHTDYECQLALNTDSKELIDQVKSFNTEFTYIERTEELGSDKAGKLDVIRDTYRKINKKFDLVIDLDLTSPLRRVKDIEGCIEALLNNDNADLSFSMTTSRRSPFFNQVISDKNGFFHTVIETNALTRQEVPVVYDMNASIYVYKHDFMNKQGGIFNGHAVAYEMKDTAVLDIDNPEDKDLMQILAKYFYANYPEYDEINKYR